MSSVVYASCMHVFHVCEHVACTDKMVTATILAQATRSLGIPCGFQLVVTCEVPRPYHFDTLTRSTLVVVKEQKCTYVYVSAPQCFRVIPLLRECLHLRVFSFIALVFGLTFINIQHPLIFISIDLFLTIYPVSHVSWDSLKSYSFHARALCCFRWVSIALAVVKGYLLEGTSALRLDCNLAFTW